jgi:hypothetical protein
MMPACLSRAIFPVFSPRTEKMASRGSRGTAIVTRHQVLPRNPDIVLPRNPDMSFAVLIVRG